MLFEQYDESASINVTLPLSIDSNTELQNMPLLPLKLDKFK